MAITIVDGVERLPENGVKVIIAGAGVAGLQTALECWRKGCNVVVLEKSEALSSIGDFFTITPSALTTLKHYPSMLEDYHSSVYDCTIHVVAASGRNLWTGKPEWNRPGVTHVAPEVDISFLKRRPEYAKMQLDQVERLGIPVHWGQKVVSVEELASTVTVKTESGETFVGDVCISASGIGAEIPGFRTGPEVAVQDAGYAVARVAFPRSDIKEGSPASSLLKNIDNQPEFRTYVGNDFHLILFLTKDWVAFAFTHPDHGAKESWSHFADSDKLVGYLEQGADDWDPAVLDFIRSAPREVVDWKLRWRDGSPQWTSEGGRLVRIGDSAHAFFPTAGNGAVQGLEDAVSLAECIRVGGKEGVAQATKVHNELRWQRVSILQRTGFLNREELHSVDTKQIENTKTAEVGFFKIGRWVWGHNPEVYAKENYSTCLSHLENGSPFTYTNVPPGHKYEPWSLESEKSRMQAGIKCDLKRNGDWGY